MTYYLFKINLKKEMNFASIYEERFHQDCNVPNGEEEQTELGKSDPTSTACHAFSCPLPSSACEECKQSKHPKTRMQQCKGEILRAIHIQEMIFGVDVSCMG